MENKKMQELDICRFVWNVADSNSYILSSDGTTFLIFDPVDTEEFYQYILEHKIEKAYVILTHEHFDHISGLNRLREILSCTVYANRICSEYIQNSRKNLSALADVLLSFKKETISDPIPEFCCAAADVVFDQDMELDWLGHKLYLFTAEGHTKGSICILLDGKYLFSGDTLLEIPTVTRLPGGDIKAYREVTMPRLEELAKDGIRVYPGHGRVFWWRRG